MVVPNVELVFCSFQVVVPLLQRVDDREHILVGYRIVSFFWTHGVRGVCNRVPLVIFQHGEDYTSCKVQSVCLQSKMAVIVWISKNGSSGEAVLQLLKSVGFCGSPGEHLVFLGQVCQRFGKSGIIFDEAAIEVGEAKEAADTAYCRGCRPVCNCFHLGIVHSDAIMVDEHSQIFYLHFVKRALFGMCEEVVVAEALQNLLHFGLMFSKRPFGENHDIVDIDDDDDFHVCEDFVHHGLEHGGGVIETEEHDHGFE